MSDEEFAELTPGEFQALCRRRIVKIKHERFANALTAAAVYNTHRHSDDAPVISASDFVRDEEEAEKQESMRKAKRFAKKVIGGLPVGTPREKIWETRLKAIADLRASGYEDAEQIFDDCWPTLKPKETA